MALTPGPAPRSTPRSWVEGQRDQLTVDPRTDGGTGGDLAGRGRTARLAVTVVVLALVGMGSVMGTDDVFPFGPFRMYATATSPTGRVGTVVVRGVDAAGRERRIPLGELGLRGAEIEGQLPRFVADPDLLGGLARVYNDRRPDGPPVVALRIERDYVLIDDARVTGRTRRVVARWPR